MATNERWKKAQAYERSHWNRVAQNIEGNKTDLQWYEWSAKTLLNLIKKAYPGDSRSFERSCVLEVGSGPIGIVSFLEANKRYAIDPLCDYFSSQKQLIEHRNENVIYQQARGEKLGFSNGYFDLVIIDNVIDHVQNTKSVMEEINRVLKPKALLFLSVNLHPPYGAIIHKLASSLRIDKGHPHTFTISKIRDFLQHYNFRLKFDEWEDYKLNRKKDMHSPSLKSRMKSYSGLSEFLYLSVSEKE